MVAIINFLRELFILFPLPKMWRTLGVLSFIYSVLCIVPKKDLADILEKNRMIGVDAIHNVKIDKDTIITRNGKLEQKNKGRNGKVFWDSHLPSIFG